MLMNNFFLKKIIMSLCFLAAINLTSQPEDQDDSVDIVEQFTKLRSTFGHKVVLQFFQNQKPLDGLRCIESIIEQLSSRPREINKLSWNEILKTLQLYVGTLEKLYVISDSEPLFQSSYKEKPPKGSKSFLDWWKLYHQKSYVDFFGIYFDYHLIAVNACALSAWELIDADTLYTDIALTNALAALNKSVTRFAGIPKFAPNYERRVKKATEFVNDMRKRIARRKYGFSAELFTGVVAGIPRLPDSYGLLGGDSTFGKPVGEFCESFLSTYGICKDERNGHEYHDYLLEQTAHSYTQLENALSGAGLNLNGRIMIFGYEGEAFDSYFSNYNDLLGDALCDENPLKGNAGWSKASANYFGFLTAYALRTANKIDSHNGLFEHIHEDSVELYNRSFELFQRDSFRQLYAFVRAHEEHAKIGMQNGDVKHVLDGMVKFLESLYVENLMINDGSSVISIATQDILFNRKQLQQLCRSTVPTLKMYTGADITYGIDVTERRGAHATRHAQAFVKKFTEQLVPRNDQSTVYVFNSFIDGVGKTTTLGNIKNWMKYGSDMEKYEAADNSSSQLADIFEFSKDVFIADLPAQISHFTYKPNGYVFVEVSSLKGFEHMADLVRDYFAEHTDELTESYHQKLEDVAEIIKSKGWHAPELNTPEKPFDAFAKNLHLLKKIATNTWIPCEFQGKAYLVDFANSGEVRMFKSFAEGQSSGLKNVQADQMFFFDGVTLPLSYKTFLNDLTSRCREKGIKEVCFVDFLSMYSRSPRENIRVIYLMQQMALLFNDFDQKDTVYREITDNCELLAYLYQRPWYARLKENLKRESLVRWALNLLLEEWKDETLSNVTLERSTQRITELLTSLSDEFKEKLEAAVDKRLGQSSDEVEFVYGTNKDFVNVQMFSWDAIISYARELEQVFSTKVTDRVTRKLWGSFGGDIIETEKIMVFGSCDRVLPTTDGSSLRVRWVIDPDDRNKLSLTPVFRILRQIWYNVSYQFISAPQLHDGKFKVSRPLMLVPWSIRRGTNGFIYVVQPDLPNYEGEVDPELAKKEPVFEQFVNFETTQWAMVSNRLLALDIDKVYNTSLREYSFGNEEKASDGGNEPRASRLITTKLISEFVQQRGSKDALFLALAAKRISELKTKSYMQKVERMVIAGDEKRGKYRKDTEADEEQDDVELGSSDLRSIDDNEYEGIKLFLTLIAKMEQVVRDPDATLVMRKNNKEDIKVGLQLLEDVVLPQYFGIVSQKELYKNDKIINDCCSTF
jgi:hypothetical protein